MVIGEQVKRKGGGPLKNSRCLLALLGEMSETAQTCWEDKAPTTWEVGSRSEEDWGDVGMLASWKNRQ